MKKKLSLYVVAIFFAVIAISLILSGKVEASTYSKNTFKIDLPNTYVVTNDVSTVFQAQSQNGRDAVMVEITANDTQGKLNADSFLNLIKNTVNNIYEGANITSAKNIEKEASICPDVVFNRTLNGTAYYYEIYAIKSDNHIFVVTFLSFDKSFLTSSTKTNMWNSFKIKDTVKVSYGLPFTDVASKAWYRSAVTYVYSNSIINGLNSYTFGPNEKLTRSMMATILYNMSGKPNVSGTSPFKDVKNTKSWYYKAVLWASKNKIVNGYANGNFGPSDNITREQLAIMLYNYATYRKKNVSKLGNLNTFSDYKQVASYATKAVRWAVGNGVITGSNGKLNPKGNATRAEAASMIYKYCSKVGR